MPFHHDVFVLTHHARPSVAMAGGTTFHFVTDGIEAALERATTAAGGADGMAVRRVRPVGVGGARPAPPGCLNETFDTMGA